MVITSLQGGLGNQMFQYAAGAALAKRLHTEVKIDGSWFITQKTNTHRDYELGIFGLSCWKQPWWWKYQIVKNKIFTTIKELPNFSFDEELLQPNKSNIILSGYWQSEKYFADYSEDNRRIFRFPNKTSKSVQKWINKIERVNAISIHIRRGDYADNAKTKAYHGLLPMSYYEEAMSRIASQIDNPVFFVFSDDLEWVKNNLKSKHSLFFVEHNGPAYSDMQLMSICKHHIIANSSFSWWGAWLNPSDKKIVIAPKKWFNSTSLPIENRIPEKWVLL